MTLEELAALAAELKTKMEAQTGEISALKAHNAKVLTEKKDVAAELKKLKEKLAKGGEDDDEDDEDDEDDPVDPPVEPKKKKAKVPANESAKELYARLQKEMGGKMKTLEDKLASSEKARNDLAVETALSEALAAANVAVPLRAAAKALLMGARKFELDGGEVVCDGKSVRDSVADWVATDEGKAFVPAPSNGGSAAPGGGRANPVQERSKMNASEKGAYIAKHGLPAYEALPR